MHQANISENTLMNACDTELFLAACYYLASLNKTKKESAQALGKSERWLSDFLIDNQNSWRKIKYQLNIKQEYHDTFLNWKTINEQKKKQKKSKVQP